MNPMFYVAVIVAFGFLGAAISCYLEGHTQPAIIAGIFVICFGIWAGYYVAQDLKDENDRANQSWAAIEQMQLTDPIQAAKLYTSDNGELEYYGLQTNSSEAQFGWKDAAGNYHTSQLPADRFVFKVDNTVISPIIIFDIYGESNESLSGFGDIWKGQPMGWAPTNPEVFVSWRFIERVTVIASETDIAKYMFDNKKIN